MRVAYLGPPGTVSDEALAAAAPQLEPVPLKLHEIEDPEERVKAFDDFMQRFAQKTGVSWPENYNVRDDIYD